MTVVSSIITIPAITAGCLYVLRRKITSKWIDLSQKEYSDRDGSNIPSNLNGKVVVITGGNTGLGYHVAYDIAKRNGSVVLGCRNIEKGNEALATITKKTGNSNVDCIPLDLGDLKSIDEFTAIFKEKYSKDHIHAIICNAGVWIPMEQKKKTKNNFEAHFGINHLGHYLLVQNLITVIKESQPIQNPCRFVFVSSSLMKNGKLNMENRDFIYEGRKENETNEDGKKKKNKSFAPTGYCDSKLMNVLTCKYFSQKYSQSYDSNQHPNILFYSVCPGWCSTDLGRHVHFPWYMKILFAPISFTFMRTGYQGAQNILFAALEDEKYLQNGGFYKDGKVDEDESGFLSNFLDMGVEKELCELSEQLVTRRD